MERYDYNIWLSDLSTSLPKTEKKAKLWIIKLNEESNETHQLQKEKSINFERKNP